MGSNVSIASGYTRKAGFNRSNSRYSTTGVSRPHSPIVFGPQVGSNASPTFLDLNNSNHCYHIDRKTYLKCPI